MIAEEACIEGVVSNVQENKSKINASVQFADVRKVSPRSNYKQT